MNQSEYINVTPEGFEALAKIADEIEETVKNRRLDRDEPKDLERWVRSKITFIVFKLISDGVITTEQSKVSYKVIEHTLIAKGVITKNFDEINRLNEKTPQDNQPTHKKAGGWMREFEERTGQWDTN